MFAKRTLPQRSPTCDANNLYAFFSLAAFECALEDWQFIYQNHFNLTFIFIASIHFATDLCSGKRRVSRQISNTFRVFLDGFHHFSQTDHSWNLIATGQDIFRIFFQLLAELQLMRMLLQTNKKVAIKTGFCRPTIESTCLVIHAHFLLHPEKTILFGQDSREEEIILTEKLKNKKVSNFMTHLRF